VTRNRISESTQGRFYAKGRESLRITSSMPFSIRRKSFQLIVYFIYISQALNCIWLHLGYELCSKVSYYALGDWRLDGRTWYYWLWRAC